ncbi:penicillin-binding protein PBP2A [Streptococcus dentiloxodontae]
MAIIDTLKKWFSRKDKRDAEIVDAQENERDLEETAWFTPLKDGPQRKKQSAEKSGFQQSIGSGLKKLFTKKDNEKTADDLAAEEEPSVSSHYRRSKPKKEIDRSTRLGKVKAFLGKFALSPRNPLRRFWRRYHLGKVLLILSGLFVLVVGSYLFYIAKTTKVSELQDALKATTVIYDREGNQAGSLSSQKGSYVELDAVSDYMEAAVIATEDRTFYENSGINYQRFLLAVVTLGRYGGGSTITQQLAKNAFLSQEQTITRKAKEFFLSLELTKKYTKDEILTMYLNNAYFGNGVWGVEDASQKYFGTSAANLTLDQAATLAGMLKGPEFYNPIDNLENSVNRRNTVLDNMVNAGKITQDEANQAASADMASELVDTYSGDTNDYNYPSYFDAVINEAIDTYGLSEDDIVKNGYKIYTEMDTNYQTNMQETYSYTGLFPTSAYDGTSAQSASVAIDPTTGAVRGLVGRVNSTTDTTFRDFNYATQSSRSPGSTIKPLVVYSPAVASGWDIDTDLPNTVKDYDGYAPTNYGGIETEDLPMYQALANSYNIPAVYLLNEIGIDKGISYGKKFGLNFDGVSKELGVALGGSVTASPLKMAQAYSTFANGGVMNDAHFITKIENASGDVIAKHKGSSNRIISKSVSDKMTSMMLGTFSNGSAVNANVYGYTLAGKTGTVEANFNSDLTSDQWVIGYTPDVVLTTWVGYDTTDENHYLDDSSSGTASSIFSYMASGVLPYTAGNEFNVENAYAADGQALTYTAEEETGSSSSDSSSKSWTDKAGDVISDIEQGAKDLWDGITGIFN